MLVTETQRQSQKKYFATSQENRERLSVLPSHRGKHLRIEWGGYDLHVDDELWPEEGSTSVPEAALIELTIGEASVEFLAPDPKNR